MAANVWIDALLVTLVVTVFAMLYRMRLQAALPRPSQVGESRGTGGVLARYYSTVVRQAGFDPDRLFSSYWTAKVALGLLLVVVSMEAWTARGLRPSLPWMAVAAVLGLLVPDLWLLRRRRIRRWRIRRSLSFFLDLLVSLLHSGMTLEEASRRAGHMLRKHRPQPLADEVSLVALELELGKGRDEAFRVLANRTGVAELEGIAAALKLGMRVGAPVAKTLTAQADLLRTKRHEEGLRRIHRAAIQALLPTFLCGFPILILLIFFPAVLELVDAWELLRALLG